VDGERRSPEPSLPRWSKDVTERSGAAHSRVCSGSRRKVEKHICSQ
jgi:hypothetical protein